MELLTRKDFHFELPADLIAHEALAERSGSRLLHRAASGVLTDEMFKDLPRILEPGSVLVINDTRVLPGRIFGQTAHGGKIELMLLKVLDTEKNIWQALGKPFRKLKAGTTLELDASVSAQILNQDSSGIQPILSIQFSLCYPAFLEWMEESGYIPLPPYIERKKADLRKAPQSSDRDRYQTIYARERGSVAAPTAGLHFDASLWAELEGAKIEVASLTLHVGGGTFLPVKTEGLDQHRMHSEQYRVSSESWKRITEAVAKNRPLVAVGTTSLRCLESFARRSSIEGAETLLDRWLDTDLYLYPRHRQDRIKPWGITRLITNFHQPESSLLMLVAALIGYDAMKEMYEHAIDSRYRFFSYGDACLIDLDKG